MAHNTDPGLLTQMALEPEDRPKYSASEIQAYFEHINLPSVHRSSPVLSDSSLARTSIHGLPLLRALHLHHVTKIPFENLELHYSTHRTITLNMAALYTKFVSPLGRGGRCMEMNGFFGTLLRSLGYDVRNAAGRVSRSMAADPATREKQGATYDPWNHMLNLVRLDGEKWWVVDVGMGAMGPAIVYPLEDGFETEAVAPRRIRLQFRSIPEHAARDAEEAQKLWCYDIQHKEGRWIPTYCFTETEFLPQDYEMMSWFTSTNPRSFFTYSVLCTKLITDGGGGKIVGDISLFNDVVRKTVGKEREVLSVLKTEEERIRALKEDLGVELSEGEQRGISTKMRIQ